MITILNTYGYVMITILNTYAFIIHLKFAQDWYRMYSSHMHTYTHMSDGGNHL